MKKFLTYTAIIGGVVETVACMKKMINGCCLNTLHSYRFESADGMLRMQDVRSIL